MTELLYKLIFYVPMPWIEPVKTAVFTAGAGNYGEYDQCCWQTMGVGQFRPSHNSNPAIGDKNQLTHVAEYRVETIVAQSNIHQVVAALKQAHPYEEVAFDIIQLVDL